MYSNLLCAGTEGWGQYATLPYFCPRKGSIWAIWAALFMQAAVPGSVVSFGMSAVFGKHKPTY